MKGDTKILEHLNEVLTAELTAINQYFLHAKMCGDWGYERLHQKIRHESIDESTTTDRSFCDKPMVLAEERRSRATRIRS